MQQLIIKKQFSEENTGLGELNNEEEIQNPEEKTSSWMNTKISAFSPFICPQVPKLNLGSFKLGSDSKEMSESRG